MSKDECDVQINIEDSKISNHQNHGNNVSQTK